MSPGTPARTVLAAAVAFEGGLAVVAVGLGWSTGVHPLASVRFDFGGLAAGAAGTLAGLALLRWSLATRWPPAARLRATAVSEVAPLFASCSTAQLTVIAMCAGFGEELFFRAFLQQTLARIAPGWLALAAASLLFGLLHLVSPAYAVAATGFGVALGGMLLATGNALGPMVAHAGYDLAALLALRRLALAPGRRGDDSPGPAP